MGLILLRRFRRVANAEDWGRSIRSPYKHLKRYGCFSGSRSWSLRSRVSGD
jgi:hypothetical protein